MTTESLIATEKECAANATAPRVTLADLQANIVHQAFLTGDQFFDPMKAGNAYPSGVEVLTVGLFVLANGFTVVGKSAPASPENFNEELGRKLAYEDAARQLWPLMGYALREKLSADGA